MIFLMEQKVRSTTKRTPKEVAVPKTKPQLDGPDTTKIIQEYRKKPTKNNAKQTMKRVDIVLKIYGVLLVVFVIGITIYFVVKQ